MGWRARCLRLALAVECIDVEDGWAIWQQALATAALVPASKAKRFKNTLAELANADARSLPLELHDGLDYAALGRRARRGIRATGW